MHQILEMLRDGNPRVREYFVGANAEWKEILRDLDTISVDDLAKRLSFAQGIFERVCDDRYLGKTVMGWSGFAHLYSCAAGFEGNGGLAYKLAQAFERSICSLEVKFAAKEAAKSYSVADYA